MADVLAVAMLIAFFALAVAFVRACERIIGPDLEAEAGAGADVTLAEQPDSSRAAA